MYLRSLLTFFVLSSTPSLFAKEIRPHLLDEIACLAQVETQAAISFPTYYNQYAVTGYFEMPSARMGAEGDVALSAGRVANSNLYGINVQFLSHVELAGNYRSFRSSHTDIPTPDPDRTGHIKLQLPLATNGANTLPYFSLGVEQSFGTSTYTTLYLVATQEFPKLNLEASLGYGNGGIDGVFGAFAWTPWRNKKSLLKNISLIAEYDAASSRKLGTLLSAPLVPVNLGISALVGDYLQCSVFSLSDKSVAGSASLRYPLGQTRGFFPKTKDPQLFTKSNNPKEKLATQLEQAFKEQKLTVIKIAAQDSELFLSVSNTTYRNRAALLERILLILEPLVGSKFQQIHLTLEIDGYPLQTYSFSDEELKQISHSKSRLCAIKQSLIPTSAEPFPSSYDAQLLYQNKKPLLNYALTPRMLFFFGGAKGKFKYQFDAIGSLKGVLWNKLFFELAYSYPVVGSIPEINEAAKKNPSHLFNVRTDTLNYYKNHTGILEKAYIQHSRYLGHNSFSRLAVGCFESAYAGVAAEWLYYPPESSFAVGVDGFIGKKRSYTGLAFQNKVGIIEDQILTFHPFTPYQGFIDFYYFMPTLQLDTRLSMGRFLAGDVGARIELERYFDNGFSFNIWYTITDAQDLVHGKIYRDKGISFSIPLDFFMEKSNRKTVGSAAAVWLRDSGAKAKTGKRLFNTIREERR